MSNVKRYTMDVRQSDYHVMAVNDGAAIEAETFSGPQIQWVLAEDHDAEVAGLKRAISGWKIISLVYAFAFSLMALSWFAGW